MLVGGEGVSRLFPPLGQVGSCFIYSSSQRFSRLVIGSPSKVQAGLPLSSIGGNASIASNSIVSSIVSPFKGRCRFKRKQPDRESVTRLLVLDSLGTDLAMGTSNDERL